jgi:plasmid stability protein
MPSITIRNLDRQTKERLRRRAAARRRSMEAEARHILRAALTERESPAGNLADAVRRRFRAFGGLDLTLPAREPMRPPPTPKR